MNTTQYTVFWIFEGKPKALQTTDMTEAMETMENLRKSEGTSAVVLSAEHTDQVGKMGFDVITDGILPDGQEYVYKTGRDRGREPR